MRLLLLPSMDGTGLLFEPLVQALPPSLQARAVAYPPDQPLGYNDLLPLVQATAAEGGDFVVVGESFSGPLALMLAADRPVDLPCVVLCASFVRNRCQCLSGVFEVSLELTPFGSGVEKDVFPRFCVKEAAHGIELAETKSENFLSVLYFGHHHQALEPSMDNVNPYAATTTESAAPVAQRGPDRERLRRIATAQRQTNLAVLCQILLIPVSFGVTAVAGNAPWVGLVFVLVALGVVIYGAIAVYRLASVFRGKVVAVIYVFGLLVPLLGLLLLVSISSKATTILQEHGIKVGLLGADPSAI